jgi:hypothetical protein
MEEWMKQSVSQLKKLVKSRAGRVAELQMEIKILEGIIGKKVSEGDLGGSAPAPQKAARHDKAPPEPPKEVIKQKTTEEEPAEEKTELSKINTKSSDHAFEELD